MLSTNWLARRKPHWTRLEHLLDSARRDGLRSLTREDLRDLGLLYRQIAADLAAIREDPTSVHFAQYLNQLLARAHNTIYAADRGHPWQMVAFFRDWPRVFRRNAGVCAIALSLFALGGLVGAGMTLRDPDFKARVLGPSMVQTIAHREMWTHSILTVKPVASSAIATNNLSVSFVTFALGLTAGLGTIYMLVLNGLMIGVVATACAQAAMSVPLWSFVAPHGVLELPAIFIAGGGGLRLAQGLLFPGVLPRKVSLQSAGGEAVRLLLGCIPLLLVAGLVEAFISPTSLAVPLKFATGASLFALLVAYLFSRREAAAGPTGGLVP